MCTENLEMSKQEMPPSGMLNQILCSLENEIQEDNGAKIRKGLNYKQRLRNKYLLPGDGKLGFWVIPAHVHR